MSVMAGSERDQGFSRTHARQALVGSWCLIAGLVAYVTVLVLVVEVARLAAQGRAGNAGHARPFSWWPAALGLLGLVMAAAAGRQVLFTLRALRRPGPPLAATVTSRPAGRLGTWQVRIVEAVPVDVWVVGFTVRSSHRSPEAAGLSEQSRSGATASVRVRPDLRRAVLTMGDVLVLPLRSRAAKVAAGPGAEPELW
jgi:hypothetical protein